MYGPLLILVGFGLTPCTFGEFKVLLSVCPGTPTAILREQPENAFFFFFKKTFLNSLRSSYIVCRASDGLCLLHRKRGTGFYSN